MGRSSDLADRRLNCHGSRRASCSAEHGPRCRFHGALIRGDRSDSRLSVLSDRLLPFCSRPSPASAGQARGEALVRGCGAAGAVAAGPTARGQANLDRGWVSVDVFLARHVRSALTSPACAASRCGADRQRAYDDREVGSGVVVVGPLRTAVFRFRRGHSPSALKVTADKSEYLCRRVAELYTVGRDRPREHGCMTSPEWLATTPNAGHQQHLGNARRDDHQIGVPRLGTTDKASVITPTVPNRPTNRAGHRSLPVRRCRAPCVARSCLHPLEARCNPLLIPRPRISRRTALLGCCRPEAAGDPPPVRPALRSSATEAAVPSLRRAAPICRRDHPMCSVLVGRSVQVTVERAEDRSERFPDRIGIQMHAPRREIEQRHHSANDRGRVLRLRHPRCTVRRYRDGAERHHGITS